jgi:hypothetical protein
MHKDTTSPLPTPPWSGLPTREDLLITARRAAVLLGDSWMGVVFPGRTVMSVLRWGHWQEALERHACRQGRNASWSLSARSWVRRRLGVAAAVMFGPVDDVEVPLGQFPWGVGERDEYAADSHSSGGSAF